MTPVELRAATFEHTRRGYDPAQVHAVLASAADLLERTQAELETTSAALSASRDAETSLRTTMLAMSQAREDVLAAAHAEAERTVVQARREAARRIGRADDEAAGIVMDGRRNALDVIAEARRDADELLEASKIAAEPMIERIDQLRAVVRRTENLMRGMASGALGQLAEAHLMLEEAPGDAAEMQIVFSDVHDEDAEPSVSPLPAAVDRLLTHLREIG